MSSRTKNRTSRGQAFSSTALIVLAALCWGVSGGLGGMLLDQGWDPYVISFYRGLVGLLFALVWLCLHPGGSGFRDSRLWFWSAIAGLGVAGNFAFYFLSISQSSVAVAATLMYSAPVFVYLICFTLGMERPTLFKCAAIAVVVVGLVLLTRVYRLDESAITLVGVGAGLLSGLSYAGFIFSFKSAARHGSPQAILTIGFAVLASVLVWPGPTGQYVLAFTTSSWPLLLTFGVLGGGLSFGAYIVGLRGVSPGVASIVALLEPITASLFGWVVLHESLTGSQLVGMTLILVAVTGFSSSQ